VKRAEIERAARRRTNRLRDGPATPPARLAGAFDAGAWPFGIGAAGAPVTAFLLSEREGREGCNRDVDSQNERWRLPRLLVS